MKKNFLLAIIFQFTILNFSFAQVASESEMLTPRKVGTDDMFPVLADDLAVGEYSLSVESSSSMFRITEARLKVDSEKKMNARITLSGKSYTKLFLGTAQEASDSKGEGEIPFQISEDGAYFFEFPVQALNKPIECAAFSSKKKKWYGREILFDASNIPNGALSVYPKKQQKIPLKDGNYFVNLTLSGGSGKASIQNPAKMSVKDGIATAIIEWSSPNYDYMKVNRTRIDVDKKILNAGGNSTFKIPVLVFDEKFPVLADTLAMSAAHEIRYEFQCDLKSAKKTRKKW